MRKRLALASVAVAILAILVIFSTFGPNNQSFASLACSGTNNGVVDKTPSETFTVEITFKNTGTTKGAWTINVAFEGESWTWSGTPQTLTLEPSHKKTLTWDGNVPEDAPIDSMARLIVYYNDSFVPLDWWVHVVSGAELSITSSNVK